MEAVVSGEGMLARRGAGERWIEQFGGGLAGEARRGQGAGELFLTKDEIDFRAGETFFTRRWDAAEEDQPSMDGDSEGRPTIILHAVEIPQRLDDVGKGGVFYGPVREQAVAEVLVDGAAIVFDHLFAARKPSSDDDGEFLGRPFPGQGGGTGDVTDEQPARQGTEVDLCLVGGKRCGPVRDAGVLAECEEERSNLDPVGVAKSGGLGDAAAVEIGSVAAAEVDEPELVGALGVYGGMSAGDAIIHQDDIVADGAAQGTVAGDRDRRVGVPMKPRRGGSGRFDGVAG